MAINYPVKIVLTGFVALIQINKVFTVCIKHTTIKYDMLFVIPIALKFL